MTRLSMRVHGMRVSTRLELLAWRLGIPGWRFLTLGEFVSVLESRRGA